MSVGALEMVQAMSDLAAPFTGTLGDLWQAAIGDRVAAWRLIGAARLQQKVREDLRGRNLRLDASKIPERYAFAWFEEPAKDEDAEAGEGPAAIPAGDSEQRADDRGRCADPAVAGEAGA